MVTAITYNEDLAAVNWKSLKRDLAADQFDNGRSAEQLHRAFESSRVVILAWSRKRLIGTARALSDGVSDALVLDVWTRSDHRGRGIGRAMIERLLAKLPGQHVACLTTAASGFFQTLGFKPEPGGWSFVVGK